MNRKQAIKQDGKPRNLILCPTPMEIERPEVISLPAVWQSNNRLFLNRHVLKNADPLNFGSSCCLQMRLSSVFRSICFQILPPTPKIPISAFRCEFPHLESYHILHPTHDLLTSPIFFPLDAAFRILASSFSRCHIALNLILTWYRQPSPSCLRRVKHHNLNGNVIPHIP